MAEVLARRRIEDLGWDRVEVCSAGVGAFDGSRASGGAVRAAGAQGLDLTGHSATLLTGEEVRRADLILAMSASHLTRIAELGGGEKATMITSFAEEGDEGAVFRGVPDPIGGPDAEYADALKFLDDLIARALKRIEPMVKP
jgi:protein-tyrosine-phosphatase